MKRTTTRKTRKGKHEVELTAFEQEAVKGLYAGKPLLGEDGVLSAMVQRIVQASLNGEVQAHLDQESEAGNRRNGYTSKRLKTSVGEVDIATPRDRAGTFDPQLVGKRQRVLNAELDQKILGLYGLGMSYRDIGRHLREIYGVETNEATINAVTELVVEDLRAWQSRPLERIYAMVWMDAAFFKIKHEGAVRNRAVYTVLAVTLQGHKDVLGMYIEETEGARFWLGVLSDLQQRGVQDILITCTDNLKGFPEAIEAVFPRTDVQGCIVHQVRNSMRHVSYKEVRELVADMRMIYKAPNAQQADAALEVFAERWEQRYPRVVESWRSNWPRLSSFLRYPEAIRRLMYTTNIIEGYHAQLRRVTKTKRVFDGDKALLKLLYLVQQRIAQEHWRNPMRDWRPVYLSIEILFKDRLTHLD